MTAPALIKQADIARAAKAAKDAGWKNARMTIDLRRGTIDLVLFDNADPVILANEWDVETSDAA